MTRRGRRETSVAGGKPSSRGHGAGHPRRHLRAAVALLVLAGLAVYANSFGGMQLLDDYQAIALNKSIQRLWPISDVLSAPAQSTVAGRPIVNLTFAINYAIGGAGLWGYHAVNLAVHMAAALLLFGILRRTWPAAVGGAAETPGRANGDSRVLWLAAVAALIWVVHPLQTESVTYLVQRTESLMGLFYLLTLYCAMRGMQTTGRAVVAWFVAAVVACALGMACKEVMVTAPLMVLLYDRVFVTGSFHQIVLRRGRLYLGLAATWILLVLLMAGGPRSASVGFAHGVSALTYAENQCQAILTYLKLAFWPHPLLVDYGVPRAIPVAEAVPYAAALGVLLAAVVIALVRRPAIGFLGAWFFIILAPTSSFVPIISEVAAERRMYLPLAAVIVLAVALADRLFDRLSASSSRYGTGRSWAKGLIVVIVVGLLGSLTIRRNAEYHDPFGMWKDLLAVRPDSARAYANLGLLYSMSDRQAEALQAFQQVLKLGPDDMATRANLGKTLAALGRHEEAVAEYQRAMAMAPDDRVLRCSLGSELEELGRVDEAMECYQGVLKVEPGNTMAGMGVGSCLQRKGEFTAAATAYRGLLAVDARNLDARCRLATCLVRAGKFDEAIAECRDNLARDPRHAPSWHTLGNALAGADRKPEALDAYRQALRIDPRNAETRCNIGIVLGQLGQVDEAIAFHLDTLRMFPSHVTTRFDLAKLLEQQGRPDEAAVQYAEVLRIEPGHAAARAARDRLAGRSDLSR
ncbi:MAG TPA: tetratricopeptide repeat protein [Phycisphaerae bacterium]|nr:tetratricopeptide repeat protein [Phycisphaerae bacterium]